MAFWKYLDATLISLLVSFYRMVYLLHVSTKFIIPLIMSMKRPNSSLPLDVSANFAGRNSVGLVVKRGWHLQKILQAGITQLIAEVTIQSLSSLLNIHVMDLTMTRTKHMQT